MANNFYCWTLNAGKQSACSWYRIMVPMLELQKMDLATIYEDNNEGDPKLSQFALLHSDVGYFYSLTGTDVLHRIRSLKRISPGRRQTETGPVDIFPPAIIWDCDDNTDFVHPFNTTFAHMGVRAYPDGHLLKPGEVLEFVDSEGKPLRNKKGDALGWVDKETRYNAVTFDIERNLHDMKVRHAVMREAHGVTCASPMLAKYIKDVIGCPHVHVFPNSIDPSHYETIRAVRKDKRVRILWQGGMSHLVDWYPLRDALKAICQKYRDKITLVMFGEYFDWINDVIPADMLEYHPWIEYPGYRLKRGLLNVDINLCPLVNNVFNACKSAIKHYESAIHEDLIEATLAQRGPVFNEIVDGETGLLFDTPEEFVEKLSLLIENAELRARLHANAHKWVLANRTPAKTVPGLFDFFAETRARQKRDLGNPIIKPATMDEIKKATVALR